MLHLFKAIGIFDLWRYLHRNDIIILVFHGTSDPKHPSKWTPLRPQFSSEYIDWCMGVISKYYRFISLDDAVKILKKEKPPIEYGIAITMDDGYKSNVLDALPVFRKYNACMTVFLPVTNVEKRESLWFDRLDYVLQSSNCEHKKFNIGNETFIFSAKGRGDLSASYVKFRKLIKKQYKNEEEFQNKIDEIISHYEKASGKNLANIFEDDPWSALLNWEEINRYQGEDVQFGSHMMDHYRVDCLNEDDLRYQLVESKKTIEMKTGNPCKYIAYPNGNYSETAGKIVLESGYEAGLTTIEGINTVGCDITKIKRVCLPWTSDTTELLSCVSGFSNAVSRRRNGNQNE